MCIARRERAHLTSLFSAIRMALPGLLEGEHAPCAVRLASQALCLACGSDPEKGTQKKLGSFLMKTCFQTTCVSSAM